MKSKKIIFLIGIIIILLFFNLKSINIGEDNPLIKETKNLNNLDTLNKTYQYIEEEKDYRNIEELILERLKVIEEDNYKELYFSALTSLIGDKTVYMNDSLNALSDIIDKNKDKFNFKTGEGIENINNKMLKTFYEELNHYRMTVEESSNTYYIVYDMNYFMEKFKPYMTPQLKKYFVLDKKTKDAKFFNNLNNLDYDTVFEILIEANELVSNDSKFEYNYALQGIYTYLLNLSFGVEGYEVLLFNEDDTMKEEAKIFYKKVIDKFPKSSAVNEGFSNVYTYLKENNFKKTNTYQNQITNLMSRVIEKDFISNDIEIPKLN